MINGGIVSVEDGTKAKEEYAPARKVKVEISFAVPEGEDGDKILTTAGDTANAHVARLLGTKAPAAPAKVETTRAGVKLPPAVVDKSKEKTKADLAKEAGLPGDTVHKASPTAAAKDELDDLLDNTPTPVTDAELGTALQAKNGKMKDVPGWSPQKIRELVGKFVLVDGAPKAGAKFHEVPAAVRHDFLKELEALK